MELYYTIISEYSRLYNKILAYVLKKTMLPKCRKKDDLIKMGLQTIESF